MLHVAQGGTAEDKSIDNIGQRSEGSVCMLASVCSASRGRDKLPLRQTSLVWLKTHSTALC